MNSWDIIGLNSFYGRFANYPRMANTADLWNISYDFKDNYTNMYTSLVDFGGPFNGKIPSVYRYGQQRVDVKDYNIFGFSTPYTYGYTPYTRHYSNDYEGWTNPVLKARDYYNYNDNIFGFLKTNTTTVQNSNMQSNPFYRNLYQPVNIRYNQIRINPSRDTQAIITNALLLANSQIGVREIGSSNNSAEVNKYRFGNANGQPWCASFVSWLYGAGQNSDNKRTFGYNTSSQSIKQKAVNAGCYAPKASGYKPQPGDLMVLSYGGGSGHIGIIDKVNADGSFEVIEGNSSNQVKRVHRSLASNDLNGFVDMTKWLEQTA